MKTTYIIVASLLALVVLSGCLESDTKPAETCDTEECDAGEEITGGAIIEGSDEIVTLQTDFETPEARECWEFKGEPSAEPQASKDAYAGEAALAITNTETPKSYYQLKRTCLIEPDKKEFELTAFIRGKKEEVGDIGGAHIEIEFWNETDVVESFKTDNVKLSDDNIWKEVTTTAKAPKDAITMNIKLSFSGTGTAIFDDLKIVEV